MVTAGKRARSLETVVSVFLLGVLVVIGVGVFVKQFRYGQNQSGDTALMPAEYEKLSEIETYGFDNLYEKINGKAPMYTESGFKQLQTLRFVNTADSSLIAELYLYDMGTVKNAFSVYSLQKRAQAKDLADLGLAYKTANGVYFCHGNYYVEIVGFSEDAQLLEAILETAGNIKKHLPISDRGQIAEFGYFAEETLQPKSMKLYVGSAFGCEDLADTFSAKYEINGEIVTAFLAKRKNSGQAKETAKKYYDFLIENGAEDKALIGKNINAFCVDLFGSIEMVMSTGAFVIGIHEAENQKSAEELMLSLIDNVK
jgi:hypothetical protein